MKRFDNKIIFLLIISVISAPIDAAKTTGFNHKTTTVRLEHKNPQPRSIPPISPERQVMRDKKQLRQCKENCCVAAKACGLICCALVADDCIRGLWRS